MNHTEDFTEISDKEKKAIVQAELIRIAGTKQIISFVLTQFLFILYTNFDLIAAIVKTLANPGTAYISPSMITISLFFVALMMIVPTGLLLIGIGGYKISRGLILKGLSIVYPVYMILSGITIIGLVFLVPFSLISLLGVRPDLMEDLFFGSILLIFYLIVHRIYLLIGGIRDYFVINRYDECGNPKPAKLIPFITVGLILYTGYMLLSLINGLFNLNFLQIINSSFINNANGWITALITLSVIIYTLYTLIFLKKEFEKIPFNENEKEYQYD